MYFCIAKKVIIINNTIYKMKKLISSLLVVATALCATVAKADNITLEQAKDAAAHYMSKNTYNEKVTPADMLLVHQVDNLALNAPAAFFFNVNNGEGWIIMAATTVINPVIGYSGEGKLDMASLPDNMRSFVEAYIEDVKQIQMMDEEENLPDDPQWTVLAKHQAKWADNEVVLTNVRWDQGETGSSNNNYNHYCPTYQGQTCYVGCGATAMAQMCYYYRYPVQPRGTKTYVAENIGNQTLSLNFDTTRFDYDNMVQKIMNATSVTRRRAVAWISYACGIACGMQYGVNGSSTTSEDVASGAATYLKYQSGSTLYREYTSVRRYIGIIRNTLKANDLVYMRGTDRGGEGRDAGGHAWLCTGYKLDDTTMYYMNWGWNGNSNGFFNLSANQIATSQYNFNYAQGIIYGMVPPEDSNIHHTHVKIDRIEENTVLSAAYPNPASDYVSLPYESNRSGEVKVYGIDGRLVSSVRVPAGNGVVNVNVAQMPAGVYIYRLNNASGKFIVK